MKKIIIIAKKEFLDLFRDKRTLIRMILIPLLAFPLIINLVTMVQSSTSDKEATKELEVGYVLNGQSTEMIESMAQADFYTFTAYSDTAQLRADVKSEQINLGIFYPNEFDNQFESGETPNLMIYMRQADMEEYDRFENLLEEQDSIYTDKRMASVDRDYGFIEPFTTVKINQSTFKEIMGKYAGGILPYIFLAFCFMGCMIPAIDMFAGEKERGTIETLLTTPVKRIHIVIGKMTVITAFGLISATLALVGLFLSLYLVDMSDEVMSLLQDILTPQLILTLYVLLIPLAIFFAGIMIPISVYSRSFKEAQSILTPLNIVVVLPAVFGFLPGIELDYTTAFIPILNVVLATKSIIAGSPDLALIAITFFSLILLATIAVVVSIKQFDKESNVLR